MSSNCCRSNVNLCRILCRTVVPGQRSCWLRRYRHHPRRQKEGALSVFWQQPEHVAGKQDRTIKGRMVHNGQLTRDWLTKEDTSTSSPTVGLDGSMFTLVINAKERCNVMAADALNTFIQMELGRRKGQEKTAMKITGVLVDSPVAECPLECGTHAAHVLLQCCLSRGRA